MSNAGLPARDARVCWHPWTQHFGQDPPIPVIRGEGAWLVGPGNQRYLDAISSWWVTVHGHAHPAIAAAIGAQAALLDQVIFAGCTHEPAVGLAEELLARLPSGLARIFYSDDGSTAVEVALKMALQFHRNRGSPRSVVLALENAYHGDTFGAMSVSARGVFTAAFQDQLFAVERLPAPGDPGLLPALDRMLDHRGSGIAAIIVEPLVQGAAGMRMWDAATLRALAGKVRSEGVLLIADEVMTGFGRTGPLFACEHADVSPDLICLSKGLTGGSLPLGVTAATEEVFEAFLGADRRTALFHGHSYTANPIACAAARASLALFDERSADQRRALEAVHRDEMSRLARHPRVLAPRVLGTIAAFDLADSETGYLSSAAQGLTAFGLERGVLLRPLGSVVYVMPPYCTRPEELRQVYAVLAEFLETR